MGSGRGIGRGLGRGLGSGAGVVSDIDVLPRGAPRSGPVRQRGFHHRGERRQYGWHHCPDPDSLWTDGPGRTPDRASVEGCQPTATRTSAVVAGRYVLLDQVGAGGMGSVWRAWDERTRRHVALKVLGQHSSALLARFVREQAVRVRHPHVVAPHGWAAEDDLVVLAMELVPGGSVADLLREHGPLDRRHRRPALRAAADGAVGRARRRAGAPRREAGQPAARGDRQRAARTCGSATSGSPRRSPTVASPPCPGAIGTDGYMAPEQARGALPEPTQDLYAVGRVVLEMVTGLPPVAPAADESPPTRCARSRAAPRRRPRAAAGHCRRGAAPAPPAAGAGRGRSPGARPARAAAARSAYAPGGRGARRLAGVGRRRCPAGGVVGCLSVLVGTVRQ